MLTTTLEDGRHARACVLARHDGTARRIAVCAADARRLAGGEQPDIRLVRVGDRYVPWYAAPHERGLLTSVIGALAVSGAPKHVMYAADLNRARNVTDGGGHGPG